MVIKYIYKLKKLFRFEPGYFRFAGNPVKNFLRQGNIFAHLIDRIKFRLFPKFQIVSRFPTHLDIETASACQMKCPMCYTTYMDKEKKGVMDYDLFTKIIDEAAKEGVYSVKLSWRGEPLLNKRIIDMVKYAKSKKIKEVAMLSNAELMNSELARQLVDSGLDWISFSIDGVYETYETIRAPAKFDETIEKVKFMTQYREQSGKTKPMIRVQSILSALNDDTKTYLAIWKDIADQINFISDQARDFELKEMYHDPEYLCPTPWARMSIDIGGHVHQCNTDYDGKWILGDVAKQSIYDIWHGKDFKLLRHYFNTNTALQNCEACNICSDNVVTESFEIQVGEKKIKAAKYKGIPDVVENGKVTIPTLKVKGAKQGVKVSQPS